MPASERRFYAERLARYGDSPRSLSWSEEGQCARFRVLREVGIESSSSVLDVGCGLGHFHWYLAENGFAGSYVGIDALSEMIERARARVPPVEPSAYACVDALDASLPQADYVVSSGMLNLDRGDNLDAMKRLIRACYGACRVACAINMLSLESPRDVGGHFHYDPSWALQVAMLATPRVVLRHDYRDNDFTIYLRR